MKNEQKKERKTNTNVIPSGMAHRALLKNSQSVQPAQPDFTKRRPGSLSRSILAMALFALFNISASATITVTGLVSQITSAALETKITFTPAADILLLTNGLSAGPAKTISSASNGGFTNTFNPGTYLVRLPLVSGRNAFTIAVPHGNGIENITNLIAAPWTYEQFVNTIPTTGGTVQTNISWTAVTNLTSFGALTNGETRNVGFQNMDAFNTPGNFSFSSDGLNFGLEQVINSSGIVTDAQIASTIARDSEVTAADTVVSNGVVSSLAAGSYGIFGSTNVLGAGLPAKVIATNGLTTVHFETNSVVVGNKNRTNATIHLKDGAVWLPNATSDYGAVDGNQYAGLLIWKGLNGTNNNAPLADNAIGDGFAKIGAYYYWGGTPAPQTQPGNPSLLITAPKIRLEEGYAYQLGDYAGEVSVGNEDHFGMVNINSVPIDNAGVNVDGLNGRSHALGFRTYNDTLATGGTTKHQSLPGIQARGLPVAGLPFMEDYSGFKYYAGELDFYSVVPVPRTSNPETVWNDAPGLKVATMHTNAWEFFGDIEVSGRTNAITIVSNQSGYVSITLSGTDATTRGANGTYYQTANSRVLTNGATKGLWIDTLPTGTIYVTNATYPDSAADGADTALLAGVADYVIDDNSWVDNAGNITSMTVTSTSVAANNNTHPKFHGDGSALTGVVVYDGTSITNVSAKTLRWPATSTTTEISATVGDYFRFGTTNAEPGVLGFSSTVHGSSRGVVWLGMGSGDIVIDPGYQNARGLQIGNSGNSGAYHYIQYGMLADSTFTNGFSHPLAWRARSYSGGASRQHTPGIVGMAHYGNTAEEGQLVFYSKVPYWALNNKQVTSPTTSGVEVFRAGTNGIVASLGRPFVGGNFTINSNAISAWPTAPANRGDAAIVSSNGYPYILLSTNGTGGSTTWTGTNKLGW